MMPDRSKILKGAFTPVAILKQTLLSCLDIMATPEAMKKGETHR